MLRTDILVNIEARVGQKDQAMWEQQYKGVNFDEISPMSFRYLLQVKFVIPLVLDGIELIFTRVVTIYFIQIFSRDQRLESWIGICINWERTAHSPYVC
jgi:hypothetical protein